MKNFLLAASLALLAACDPANDDGVFDIPATGAVEGVVFLDNDASAGPSTGDQPRANTRVALVLAGTADTVGRVLTGLDGAFLFPSVPVGHYEVVVPSDALGDSITLVFRDPPGPAGSDSDGTVVTVAAGDTASAVLGLGYPIISIEQARLQSVGRRVMVLGVALSEIGALGDSAVYVRGATRAIRATRATGADVVPGDSVRVTGTIALRDGQPVLTDAQVVRVGGVAELDTLVVTATRARTADGGVLDAQLVRVSQVTITDTATAGSRFRITVEDPSGVVQVVIPTADVDDAYVPGAELDVTGLLVPRQGVAATWDVRPRSEEDITVRP